MCGFVGFVSAGNFRDSELILRRMAKQISHRGPDAEGVWDHAPLKVAFAHRRLSIQDISPFGAQPMVSPSGRFSIIFNGEIYNFLELRSELESTGFSFRGRSDTEVMLAGFECWGVREALHKFVGMFAFALCDLAERKLYLARDRLGEKPLYYGWQRNTFLFGSELKALQPHPDWRGVINRDSLTLLLRHNYIPAPHSVYEDIYKLEPASLITLDLNRPKEKMRVERYWVLEQFYARPCKPMDRGARLDELEQLLKQAVRQQMISDVPLGAFLSGGIDSSTVVALMQSQSSMPVKTFSIGFHERGFNEAEHAKAVANHLGTEHTELYVTSKQAMDVIPSIPSIYDEPFADSSQIPTFLMCEMTRRQVAVALSGDGGDELFCGYSRFFSTTESWERLKHEGGSSLGVLKSALFSVPPQLLAPFVKLGLSSQRDLSLKTISDKLLRIRQLRRSHSLREYYRTGVSYWLDPEAVVLGAKEPSYSLTTDAAEHYAPNPLKQMMLLDSKLYLPDDILVKVDRASMANSLEARIPFLDHRVVEYAASIPVGENLLNGSGKQLLKDLLYRHVPRELVDRPKKGFAVPLSQWLQGPLREWANELLEPLRIQNEGYFDPGNVLHKWNEHLAGRADHSFQLWGVLCFQAWLEQQNKGSAVSGRLNAT